MLIVKQPPLWRIVPRIFLIITSLLSAVAGGAATLPTEPLGPSSRTSGLIFSEIMYHPRWSNTLEFVEIYNAELITQNMSGFRLSGDIAYTFPTNTTLAPRAFLVVARDPAALQSAYGISGVLGPWLPEAVGGTNSLPDDAGRIRLRNRPGAIFLEVNYEGNLPWPIAADGSGHSMVLARASYGEDDPRAWDASANIGGSPGGPEPTLPAEPRVVINEFLANSPDPVEDFIELYNSGTAPTDLSGAWLSDDRDTNKFRIPDSTVLQPGGFIQFTESTMGFSLGSGGERIYLVHSNQMRLLDLHVFEAQALGTTSGRYPDGTPGFQELTTRTPGAANSQPLTRDIVINELMYNPISGDDDDEYVELYNRGAAAVNVGGWRFTAGIDFTIPQGSVIPANGYLVVSRNADRLRTNYSQLTAANMVGNYGGQLANGGERVALAMPEYFTVTNGNRITTNANYIVVDEVNYIDGGRWGIWADGGGSSLELIDPDSDNRLAPNWAESDESLKAEWVTINHHERLDHIYPVGSGGNTINELQLMLLGGGEALVDDLEVHNETPTTGPNLVVNGDFANGTTGWVIQGNHVKSSLEPAGPGNPSASLRIRASAGGDNGANRVEKDLTATIPANVTASVRGRARWLRGHRDLLFRFHGGGLEGVVTLPVPANLGSPGLVNSRYITNAGPAITEVTHTPALPATNEPVVVTARVNDPDGIAAVELQYRIDPANTLTTLPMRDDGSGGDAQGNDGIYSATLPGSGAGTLVAFRVRATDTPTAATLFPNDAPIRECFVRFGDPRYTNNIGVYRIWMKAANISTWTSRERLSNEALDGTMVYNNYRVIYNAAARYRGSPFIRPGYNGPTAGACGYVWVVPDDDLFLGEDEINLDSLEPQGRDATALREITAFTILEQLGYPSSYQRFVHVVINGVNNTSRNIPIYSDSQQPNSSYISSWFPDNDDGDIYKIDDWFEFDDSVSRQSNKSASLQNFTTVGGVKKKARYRWSWEKKFNRGLNDDYSTLFASVDAINASDANLIGHFESMFDSEQYLSALAFRHVVGDWDGYGYNRGKNQFTYVPRGGKFAMLMWDLDFAIGCTSGHGPTQNLFEVAQGGDTGSDHMPEIARIYNHPYFRRIYLRALKRMADGPLQDANWLPIMDARYRALQTNGVNTANPYTSVQSTVTIPAFMQGRRNFINSQVPNANFAVTSTNNITTTNNLVTITGTAPVLVKTIRVNGQDYPVTWTSVTAWRLQLPVSGNGTVTIQGAGLDGSVITTNQPVVDITYTGPALESPVNAIVFNEIMYRPLAPDAEFIEIFNKSASTFDLSGWRVNGVDFTFPRGSYITNGQALILARDRVGFSRAYGNAIPVFGQFEGNLDADGETISLIKPGATTDQDVVVDRVRYEPNAPWSLSAAGEGASLQLLDASQDNSRASNWAETGGWKFASLTGTLPVSTNLFRLYLNVSNTTIYVDDLSLVAGSVAEAGPNLIQNGNFEGPLLTNDAGPWSFSHSSLSDTVISSEFKHSGNSSLKLVHTTTTGPTAHLIQNVEVPTAGTYTLSFWYLPVTNVATLTARVTATHVVNANVQKQRSSPGVATPGSTVLPPYPPLWLNELQPNNFSGIRDASNTTEPWIELYNAGTNAVSLAGLFLADNYSNNLTQWAFPADATIGPGQFKIIWADGDAQESSGTNLHTSFRLHPLSGTIALTRMVGDEPQIIDYLTYSNIGPNLSYGDYTDGQPFFRYTLYTVTPGATNVARPGAVYINEWVAGNQTGLVDPADGDFEDWFELFNPNNYPVDLSGYYLADSLTNSTQFRIPNGYVIPPFGYLLVWADDNETDQNDSSYADLHTSFALSRSGDAIGLFSPDGILIDGVTFPAQTNDVSQGRFPDGSDNLYFMTTLTPREANFVEGLGNNTAPALAPITDKSVILGQTWSFSLSATDADVPAQTLTYSLVSGPSSAFLNSASGLLTWTPAIAPSTNVFTVRVRDNGLPPMSDTETFTVRVMEAPRAALSKNGSEVSINFSAINGQRYQVEYNDQLRDTGWQTLGAPVTASGSTVTLNDTVGAQPQRFYRVRLVE